MRNREDDLDALQAAFNVGMAGTGKRIIMGAELDALIAERLAQREREKEERAAQETSE